MSIAEESLRSGNVTEALEQLQNQVRNDPSNIQYRVFLFQLLCVLGQWDRALTQLNVAAEMDPSTLAMAAMYREALQCEALRKEIFEGKRTPLVFGEPQQWIAWALEALKLSANGKHAESQSLREQAYEEAPAVSGTINDNAFEWIADADSRIGPFLEAIINGNYFWIPFNRIKSIKIDEPEDLRDMVWTPAYFTWDNGGETVGLIPTRYSGSESSDDGAIRLSRKTEWQEMGENAYFGLGQRLFATDAEDIPLLDVRTIEFNVPDTDSSEQ